MSNTVRNVLIGLVVVALGVNAYFLWQGSDEPKVKKVVESTNASNGKQEVPTRGELKAVNDLSKDGSFDPLNAQKEAQKSNIPTTSINFNKYEHDFGTINQDTENAYTFTFTNTGNEPLVIEQAKGSCGCTVPTFPKEPIPPGGTGEIGVVYKPGKQKNAQNKTVTITANTDPVQTTLKIKANVLEVTQ